MANDVTRRILIKFDAEVANADKAIASIEKGLKDQVKSIDSITTSIQKYSTGQRDANGKMIVSQKAVIQMYVETEKELKKIQEALDVITTAKLGTEFKNSAEIIKIATQSITEAQKKAAKEEAAAVKQSEQEKRAERKQSEREATQSAKAQEAAEKKRIKEVQAAEVAAYKEDMQRTKERRAAILAEINKEANDANQLAQRLQRISQESLTNVQKHINERLEAQKVFANTSLGIEQKLARDIAREQEALRQKLLQWEFDRVSGRKTNTQFSNAVQMSQNTSLIHIDRLTAAADAAKQALQVRQAQEAQWRMEANSYRAHQREMQQELEQRLQLDQLALTRNGGRRAVLLQQQANTEANIRRTYASQIQTYERALQMGFISTAQANQYATTALGNMASQLQTTRAALEGHLTALGGTEQRTQSMAMRVLEMIGLYRIWSSLINTVVAGLKSIPSTGIEMQATQSALHASFSSRADGTMDNAGGEIRTAAAMQMLQEEANRTGINILTLEKNYRSFMASAKMAGESTDTVNKAFKNLNTTITALHMDGSRAELTFLALAQMFNKGKIQSEELVKQLGNLLPGAFAAFAAANKKTTQELISEMKKGEIAAHETVASFLDFYAKRYGGSFAIASQGLNANLGRAETAWTNFSRTLFTLMQGDMLNAVKWSTSLLNSMTPIEAKLQKITTQWELFKKGLAAPFTALGIASAESGLDSFITKLDKLSNKNEIKSTKPMQGIRFNELSLSGKAEILGVEIPKQVERLELAKRDLEEAQKNFTIAGIRIITGKAKAQQIEVDRAQIALEGLQARAKEVNDQLKAANVDNSLEGEDVGKLLNKADKEAAKAMRDESAIRKEILDNRLNDLKQAVQLEEQVYADRDRALDKQYKAGLISLQDYSQQAHKLDEELTAKRVTSIKEQMSLIQDEINKQQSNLTVAKTTTAESKIITSEMKGRVSAELAQYSEFIKTSAKDNGIPEAILFAMMGQESGGNANALSNKGAKGLMQLLSGTFEEVMGNQDKMYDPQRSIEAGARYFAKKLETYKGQNEQFLKALAAYNAGEGNVAKALQAAELRGNDWKENLPGETKDYIKQIPAKMEKLGITQEDLTLATNYSNVMGGTSKRVEELKGTLSQLSGELKKVGIDAGDFAAKVKEVALAEMQRIATKYETPDETYAKELAFLDQLKKGIEGVTLSQVAYQKEVAAAKEKRDTANEKIFADATKPTNELKEYNTWVQKIDDSYKQLGVTSQDFFSGNSNWMDKLANSFGALTKALAKNSLDQEKNHKKYIEAYSKEQEASEKVKDPKQKEVYTKRLVQIEQDYNRTAQQLDAERYQSQVQGIAAVSMALVEGLNSRTDSEQAAARKTVQAQMVVLGQAVALAVANQASGGDPYTVWFRIAAVVATLASFGITRSGGGGGGTPKIDTKTQGTVLGNREASSKSTEEIVTIMKDVHASEYSALLDINDSIKDLSDSILTAITGIFQRGDLATPTLPADRKIGLASGITKNVSQNVLRGKGASLGDIMDGYLLQLEQFLEIKTTKSFLFGNLVKNSGSINAVSEQTNKDVTAVFKNIGRVLIDAGNVFGMDVEEAIKALRIPDLNIDIKDMTGDEAVKYFNSYISTLMDNLAEDTYPLLAAYQQLGEGMAQTVVRVAADVGIMKSVFDDMGVTVPSTSENLIGLAEALVKVAGDTDKFRENLSDFYSNFFTDNEQILNKLDFMTGNLARFDIVMPVSRQDYKTTTLTKLDQARIAQETLSASKSKLEAATKAAFEPFNKELAFLKHNAEIYGKEEKELYAIVLKERQATVAKQVEAEQILVNAAEETFTKIAKGANLLLEQSPNADALYNALEKSQEILNDFGVTTQEKLGKSYAEFSNQITALGLSVPSSIQGFKDLIAAQDLTTESGRKTAATLLLMAEEAVSLSDTAKQAASELESVRLIGFTLGQSQTVIDNLTTSFGNLGEGMTYLQTIVTGFLTDIENQTVATSYYTERQQQLIDSGEKLAGLEVSLKDLGVTAGMSPTEVYKKLGINSADIGKYLATPGLNMGTDPGAQFLQYSSLLGTTNKSTAQDVYAASIKNLPEQTKDTTTDSLESLKKFAEVQQNVLDAISAFASSTYVKKLEAVNKEISDLEKSVTGSLEGLDTLKALKVGVVNKELFDSLKPVLEITNKLGITNLDLATAITKDEKGLWTFSQEALALAPALTKVIDNIDIFKEALNSLSDATTTVAQANLSDLGKQVVSLVDASKKALQTVQTALDLQFGKGNSPEKTSVLGTMADSLGVQLSVIFNPLMTELSTLGLTTYATNLHNLNVEMGDWRQALDLAKDSLKPEEYKKYADAIEQVSTTRKIALAEERKSIMATSAQAAGRLNASELESELFSVLDATVNTIATLIQAGGNLNDILTVYYRGFNQGVEIVGRAKKDLEDTFKDIYKTIETTSTGIVDEILKLQNPTGISDFQKERAMQQFYKASADKNYQDQLSAIESIHSAIMESYSTQIESLTTMKDLMKGIRDYLKDLKLDKNLTTLSPEKQLGEARTQFLNLLKLAQGGDQDALGKITGNASKYLEIARSYFASTPEYVAIFDEIQNSLSDLAAPVNYDEQIATATANSVQELQHLLQLTEVVRKEQKNYEREKLDAINASADKLAYELAKTTLELKEFKDNLGVDLQQQFIATLNKFKEMILSIKVIPNIPDNLIDLANEVSRNMQITILAVAAANLPDTIRKLALEDLDSIAKGIELVTNTIMDPTAIAMALDAAGYLSKTVQFYASVSGISDEARILGLQATAILQRYATYSITSNLDEAAKNMELGTLRVANKYIQAVITSNLDPTAKQLKLDNLDIFLKQVDLAIRATGAPTPEQQIIIDLADRTLKDMSLGMDVTSQLDEFERQILNLPNDETKRLQVSATMGVIGAMTAAQVIDLYNKAAGPDQEVIIRALGNFVESGSLNYNQISTAYAMASGVDQQTALTITSNLIRTGALTFEQMVDSYIKASGADQEAMFTLTSNLAKTGLFSMQEVVDVYNKVVGGNKGVEYSISAKRGTTWDPNAANLATSGLNGGTTTVVTSAVLTLDQVLNNSILSYSKADVAWAYSSIVSNTGNTVTTLGTTNNILNQIYSRLWNIEVYTNKSGFFSEGINSRLASGIKVFSDYRYGNLTTFASGGISDVPAVFGEAGPEAAVPLPDGRSIPVKFANEQSDSRIEAREMLAEMKTQTEELKRSRQENSSRQDAMIQRLAQVERRLVQLESTTSLGVVR